jgi:hypothetical protein
MTRLMCHPQRVESADNAAQRLERGSILFYPTCPFPLPQGGDRKFLFQQELGGRVHKNIAYDPSTGKASGFRRQSAAQSERLRGLLKQFAENVTSWLTATLPAYASSWQLDRVSYRPQEEATRQLRLTARNDLLHVDSFPTRPTGGARILRAFANINLTEPRVWITSHPFARLLELYGNKAGLPNTVTPTLKQRLRAAAMRWLKPSMGHRSRYDDFMLRFHNFLKANEFFQHQAATRWEFPPGSAWVVMTDTCSHAVLSGRFALEHSYFVPHEVLVLPEESPASLLRRASGVDVLHRAA